MSLTIEEKTKLAEKLRGNKGIGEHITPDYQKNLELAIKKEVDVPTSEGVTRCYVFTAKNREPRCAVHINTHGGGFVRPHLFRDEIYSAKLADAIQGIVVDVDYRLAPEYPYPAAVNECYEVCRWVFSQAGKWDANPDRISMGGQSAGGTLTAAVALKANQTRDFRLCLQVISYAELDQFTDPAEKLGAETNAIPMEIIRMFTLVYTSGEKKLTLEPFCSPAASTDKMLMGLPDALVISAGHDIFRFENEAYAMRMASMGVNVTVKRFVNSDHGFVAHCTGEWAEAQQLIIDTIRQKARKM
jgi:acetyl esterase